MVTTAHMRRPIEQLHKDAKEILGLAYFEGPTWQGGNHRTAVVILTYAYLLIQRAVQGAAAESLPPFYQVARTLVERASQTAQRQ